MSQVGAGGGFTCALDRAGAAYCWGANGFGALGDGTTTASATPVRVSGGHVFETLSVGDRGACAIDAQGQAWCWGQNFLGLLGAGSSATFSPVPVAVAGGITFASIHVGLGTACGLAVDGTAWCWGGGRNGQLGDGGATDSAVPVPVAGSAALGFVEIRPGAFATCAVDAGDQVYCWGRDTGDFGNTISVNASLVPVPAADGLALAAVRPGSLYACGLDPAGTAYCWGTFNPAGQQGTGSFNPGATPAPVVGGLTFSALDTNDNNTVLGATCGVDDAGSAWCWGSNREAQLGATSPDTCAFSSFTFACATAPIAVSGGITFTSVSVGITHVCGVATDDRLYCWGENGMGQLGDGTLVDRATPTPVLDLASSSAVTP